MIDFYCSDKTCLCHHLCLSGHFIPFQDDNISRLGCTYYPIINRHYYPNEGAVLAVFLCSERCNNCYSDGQVTIKFENKKWNIYDDYDSLQNSNNKQDFASSP